MNERIQELWEQAVCGDGPHASVIADFAELIVRDCALTAGLMEHEGRNGIGAQLLDNFGIAE